jgi:hypothetical protein
VLGHVITDDLTLAAAESMVTIEYSRYPEAKGLRGLMRLVDREKSKTGYRLVYSASLGSLGPEGVLDEWLVLEALYNSRRGAK